MLFAAGWFVIQVLRPGYAGATLDQLDALDEAYEAQDDQLWTALEQQLKQLLHDDPLVKWQWHRQLNNARGVLQLAVSRNGSSTGLWGLLDWLAKSSPGNYGVLHVHDDEDFAEPHGGRADFSNAFRIWCLRRGEISEHADLLLSPICPTVVDPEGWKSLPDPG